MRSIEHVRKARERAINENMIVTLLNGGVCDVINKDRTNRYSVEVIDKKIANCTCPQFERASICKHMVKVAMKTGLAVKNYN